MAFDIAPGLVYCARVLPVVLAPSVTVYCICHILVSDYSWNIPSWLSILVSVLARPILSLALAYYDDFNTRRAAAACGAIFPPTLHSKLPGGLSIIAQLMENIRYGYPSDVYLDWTKLGNIIQFKALGERRIFTLETTHVKAILATQFEDFDKGPAMHAAFHGLLGDGVFNADGEVWKTHRSLTRPFFSQERIRDFDIFEAHSEEALKQAKARLSEGHAIDIQDLFSRFTMDSATEFLFGQDAKSLAAGLAYSPKTSIPNPETFTHHPSRAFVDAFSQAQFLTALRLRGGQNWPLFEFKKDKIKPLMKTLKNVTDSIIAEHTQSALNDKIEAKDLTLIQHLIQQTKDKKILSDEVINLLVAGRDTTASTLTFSVYMLSQHPKIAHRLRNEVLETVGRSRVPSYADIRKMTFLRAFINEVLRMYPVVPANSRTSNKATTLPPAKPGDKPIYVPANTRCIYSVFVMHRRTELWGPDAETFDPDRFLDERLQQYLIPNPYIFLPFNGGPRICLGQQFAYNEVSYLLIRLLQSFSSFSLATDEMPDEAFPPKRWEDSPGAKGKEKIMFGTHITMYAKGGLWVRMEEASESV